MLHSRFALGLLLALPFGSRAQTPAAALPGTPPAPRYYVGLAAYSSFYQALTGRPRGLSGFPVPLQLTAGYQLRPRLAVQVGVAYSGSTGAYDFEFYSLAEPATPQTYHHYAATTTVRNTSVSALARYTLTRNPAHRLQFDALGGFTLEHQRGFARGTDVQGYVGSLETTSFSNHYADTHLLLTAGLSARYRLTQRFEVDFDATTNHEVLTRNRYNGLSGFTGAAALGLRYRFGK